MGTRLGGVDADRGECIASGSFVFQEPGRRMCQETHAPVRLGRIDQREPDRGCMHLPGVRCERQVLVKGGGAATRRLEDRVVEGEFHGCTEQPAGRADGYRVGAGPQQPRLEVGAFHDLGDASTAGAGREVVDPRPRQFPRRGRTTRRAVPGPAPTRPAARRPGPPRRSRPGGSGPPRSLARLYDAAHGSRYPKPDGSPRPGRPRGARHCIDGSGRPSCSSIGCAPLTASPRLACPGLAG